MMSRGGMSAFTESNTVPQPAHATGAISATKILAAVKEQALQDVFKPASAIVEEVSMSNK